MSDYMITIHIQLIFTLTFSPFTFSMESSVVAFQILVSEDSVRRIAKISNSTSFQGMYRSNKDEIPIKY